MFYTPLFTMIMPFMGFIVKAYTSSEKNIREYEDDLKSSITTWYLNSLIFGFCFDLFNFIVSYTI